MTDTPSTEAMNAIRLSKLGIARHHPTNTGRATMQHTLPRPTNCGQHGVHWLSISDS